MRDAGKLFMADSPYAGLFLLNYPACAIDNVKKIQWLALQPWLELVVQSGQVSVMYDSTSVIRAEWWQRGRLTDQLQTTTEFQPYQDAFHGSMRHFVIHGTICNKLRRNTYWGDVPWLSQRTTYLPEVDSAPFQNMRSDWICFIHLLPTMYARSLAYEEG